MATAAIDGLLASCSFVIPTERTLTVRSALAGRPTRSSASSNLAGQRTITQMPYGGGGIRG